MIKHMDKLWQDEDSGVRNALDYNSFMGKIQRVSMNAPIQGLAGDFMRMALTHIRNWATEKYPLVKTVVRLYKVFVSRVTPFSHCRSRRL